MLGYADPDGRVSIYRAPTRRHAPNTEFEVRGRVVLEGEELRLEKGFGRYLPRQLG